MNAKFEHKYIGYNEDLDHKEYCCDIYGYVNNHWKCIGYCKYYSVGQDDDIVYIEFINISYNYRRRGYGTEMVKELLKKYTLYWDYKFTKEGRQWFESLISQKII